MCPRSHASARCIQECWRQGPRPALGKAGYGIKGGGMWLSHESAHAYEKLKTKYAGGREADRNCRRLCSRRSPAAHLGALGRGDPPFARAVSQSAPNCPAPTEIPRTQAWPHAQPGTLTSRSRPCPLWPPLRTGRGGRCARGGADVEHASVALGAGGGALACSCVTEDLRVLAKKRHPMECCLEAWSCAALPAFPGKK